MPRYTRRRSPQALEPEQEQTQEQEQEQEQEQIVDAEPQEDYGEQNESLSDFLRKYVRVLTHPSTTIFKQEVKNPTWRNTLMQLIILVVVSVLPYAAVGIPLTFLHPNAKLNPIAYTIFVLLGPVIAIPLVFFADVVASYFSARAIQGITTLGSAKLRTVAYATALFYVPIGIIIVIVGLFFSLNTALQSVYSMVFFASSLYLTAMMILAIQSLFEMTTWKLVATGVMIAAVFVFVYIFIYPIPYTLLGSLLHIPGV